jgi:hypothetical protein
MEGRCTFCNNAVVVSGVMENGKLYHPKCTPSARGNTSTFKTISIENMSQSKGALKKNGRPYFYQTITKESQTNIVTLSNALNKIVLLRRPIFFRVLSKVFLDEVMDMR